MSTSSLGRFVASVDAREVAKVRARASISIIDARDRVLRFPLPAVCKEKGLNARIADELVWQKIVDLMSSPKLMLSQAERWINSKQNKTAQFNWRRKTSGK